MKSFFPENIKRIHLIGIGGISMSALAKILHLNGYIVSGSDFQTSETLEELEAMGLKVQASHEIKMVEEADLVIFTSAIHDDNPELKHARELGIKTIPRSQFLGILTSQFTHSLSISGTHGKTTTTSMVGVMIKDIDPVILVGGNVDVLGGNAYIGHGNTIVNEACEYHRSFLDFDTSIGVILNVDSDHLDYFKDLEEIKETFLDFAEGIRPGGTVILNKDDTNAYSLRTKIDKRILTYSMKESADLEARNISYSETGNGSFDAYLNGEFLGRVNLSVAGEHNISNALAAILSVSLVTDVKPLLTKLSDYHGTARRLEVKGTFNGAVIIEDYAHHPTEIKTSIRALKRMFPGKRLYVAFQPHTYTRTKLLFEDFASAFVDAHEVDLIDIYAAREEDIYGINSKMLAEHISDVSHNATYRGSIEDELEFIKNRLHDGDVFVAMGAGNVNRIPKELLKK
ncbi:UDP-N-acetylmuramate--L-alanine ligase [Guggenheimella bovis]